ncbi:MAG: hypothetical protein DHS20C14_02510 [Phycisphaeraceae bacterium]|nr:MAG: hypothetical protein DHS20C14_02510 [Phycisphaeraceae bacterium]
MQEQTRRATAHDAADAGDDRRDPFRAEADDGGQWFVWRRLASSGWAAWRACPTRSDAIELAASLNHKTGPSAAN